MDPAARDLRKHGVRIKLQDLEKPGQLVTREELQQPLWPADTFVEFDKGYLQRDEAPSRNPGLWVRTK
jgi:hypothetical protein